MNLLTVRLLGEISRALVALKSARDFAQMAEDEIATSAIDRAVAELEAHVRSLEC